MEFCGTGSPLATPKNWALQQLSRIGESPVIHFLARLVELHPLLGTHHGSHRHCLGDVYSYFVSTTIFTLRILIRTMHLFSIAARYWGSHFLTRTVTEDPSQPLNGDPLYHSTA
jgi:hypothetical protein